MDKQIAAQKLAKLFFATETGYRPASDIAEANKIKAELGSEAKELIALATAEKLHSDLRTSLRLFVKKYDTDAYNQYITRCGYKAA